jgi:hypothetical protein
MARISQFVRFFYYGGKVGASQQNVRRFFVLVFKTRATRSIPRAKPVAGQSNPKLRQECS